jgi:transcriptional regulator with XRE-family HTH domain
MARDGLEDAQRAFQKRIRALREAKKWSLGEAGRASGLTGSLWRKYEEGEVEPRLTQLLRIQRALGLPSVELLFGPLPTEGVLE